MPAPILATKLYIPPPRPKAVLRPRLVEQLNQGLHHKLTLISAPAGFGKTTLVSEWVNQKGEGRRMKDETGETIRPSSFIPHPSQVAWLSLDEDDNDPLRFLSYTIAALQTVDAGLAKGALSGLQSPQPPTVEAVITSLINEVAAQPRRIVLVFDDYHVIDAKAVHDALTFLLEHLPPQMHLVIATREDPHLPLSQLRARGQLTELRVADLRFTLSEASGFLNQVMGLDLLADDIAALETRTEGWIAGLQLAGLALQGLAAQNIAAQDLAGHEPVSMPDHPDAGHQNAGAFIRSFTGSHRFVMDYLVEEVLLQLPVGIQDFLLRTSILDRLCGPLCDAILKDEGTGSNLILHPSSLILEELERGNIFMVPLDGERRWYRYHHLFAELLHQRLQQNTSASDVNQLHRRASQWYEENDLEIEAFHHAVTAGDVERAGRLVEGKGMPLLFRGAVAPVLGWLSSLPEAVLDANPSLWVIYASALLFVSQVAGVEAKLQSAEAALRGLEPDDRVRDLTGHIASIRATVAVTQHQLETIVTQSRRALEYLHPANLPVRTATTWTLGHAYQLQGERLEAMRAYSEAISISQTIGHFIIHIMATLGLANVQESENQLHVAAQTYRQALELIGDPPMPVACEAHLGLARIYYEWNDLEAAEQHAQQAVRLARQIENTDRYVACEVFLARLKLAQGDAPGAAVILAQASQAVRQQHFMFQVLDIAAAQVLTLLHQGNLQIAARLAQAHPLPLSQARVQLALGNVSSALAVLEPYRQQVEAKGWQDEQLKAMLLQAVALHALGKKESAVQLLGEALTLAEPGGFIRIFVDEGSPMQELLARLKAEGGRMKEYVPKLLAAFENQKDAHPLSFSPQPLIEPLSQRELEVLRLIAQGFSNSEISERLFLALSTVKGHNQQIFGKLQVQRRTEAVARARELGLL